MSTVLAARRPASRPPSCTIHRHRREARYFAKDPDLTPRRAPARSADSNGYSQAFQGSGRGRGVPREGDTTNCGVPVEGIRLASCKGLAARRMAGAFRRSERTTQRVRIDAARIAGRRAAAAAMLYYAEFGVSHSAAMRWRTLAPPGEVASLDFWRASRKWWPRTQ